MECSICLELFDKEENRPFSIIPCMHTFCNKCLSKFSTTQLCPHCNKQIKSTSLNISLWDLINDWESNISNRDKNTFDFKSEFYKFIQIKSTWNSCQKCFKQFDQSIKKPYSLIPCLHTYCKQCAKQTECIQCAHSINDSNPNWHLLKLITASTYDLTKSDLEKKINDLKDLINSIKNKQRKRTLKHKFDSRLKEAKLKLLDDKYTESEMIELKQQFQLTELEIKQSNRSNVFLRFFCFES